MVVGLANPRVAGAAAFRFASTLPMPRRGRKLHLQRIVVIEVLRTPVVKKRFVWLRGKDTAAFVLPLRRPHFGAFDKDSLAGLASINNRLTGLTTTYWCDAFAVNAFKYQHDIAWTGALGGGRDGTEWFFAGSSVPVVATR